MLIDLFTDTAAILILPPGHPIVLIKIHLFFCCDNAAYHNNRINPVLWDARGQNQYGCCIGKKV